MLGPAAFALLLLWPQDTARVTASLSADRIRAGGTAVLSIQVESSGATPDGVPIPVLPPGLDLGPISDFSELQAAFPGGRRRITRREAVIIGARPGTYRIPAVRIRVNGRTLRTPELQLLVGPAQRGEVPGRTAAVRLRAWAEPGTVYVGEQVLYQVEAVFPEAFRLRQARPPNFEPPVAGGFWTYDLPEPITVSLRMSGEDAVEVQTFRQVLFPMTAGTLAIPAAHLQYELRQGLLYTPEVHALATEPVQVRVQPLPTAAPPGFAGAVGSYSVRAALSAAGAAVGEPVSLRFTVRGRGNLKALGRPRLDSIPGVDIYQAGERVDIGFAGGVVNGEKAFEWTLVPRAAGNLRVPAIELTWFDPAAGSYRAAYTRPLALLIRSGSGADRGGLAPLREAPSGAWLAWPHHPAFLLLQLAPLAALGVLQLQRRRRRLPRGRANTDDGLRAAELLLADPRACLEQIAAWLRMQPASPGAVRLRDAVRQGLYAPVPPPRSWCEEMLREARALAASSSRSQGRAAPLLLFLALSTAASGTFARGVDAYRQGDFGTALSAFRAHTTRFPYDRVGWYDVGNAAYRADQPGFATWAWSRALRLDPRDAWARSNLRLAAGHETERAVALQVPLATEELALATAVLWWVATACVALAISRPRRRRTALGGALAAGVLMILLSGILAIRALAPERAITLTAIPLQAAPSFRAEPLRTLASGSAVVVRERRRTWLLVLTTDLREGWLEAGAVGVL